jgi:hypothetical protein
LRRKQWKKPDSTYDPYAEGSIHWGDKKPTSRFIIKNWTSVKDFFDGGQRGLGMLFGFSSFVL